MNYLTIQTGLKTKFNSNEVKFQKTFKEAQKLGINLNNTTEIIKKDGLYQLVSFTSGTYSKKLGGRYWERISLIPLKETL